MRRQPPTQLLHEIGSLRPHIASCRDETLDNLPAGGYKSDEHCNAPCTTQAPSSFIQNSNTIQVEVLMGSYSFVPSSCSQD